MSIGTIAVEAALEAAVLVALFGGLAYVPGKVRRVINRVFHRGGF